MKFEQAVLSENRMRQPRNSMESAKTSRFTHHALRTSSGGRF